MGQGTSLNIKEITVGDTDDKSPLSYQSRTVKIKTNSKSILTPVRATTLSEVLQKRNVPIATAIENDIGFNLRRLNVDNMKSFLTKSAESEELRDILLRNARTLGHSPIRISLVQPTLSPSRYKEYIKDKNGKIKAVKTKKKPAGVSLLSKEKTRHKFLRQLIALQDGLGFDPIAIPFLDLPLKEYQQTIDQVMTSLSVKDKEPIFFLDMAYPQFAELLKYVTSKKSSRLVGLFYRQYHKRVQEYETLYSYRKKDVLFVMVETDRYSPELSDISTMHMLPFMANDVMAVEFPIPPIVDKNDVNQIEKFRQRQSLPIDERIQGFNKEQLTMEDIGSLLRDKESILKDVGRSSDPALKEMLDNYTDAASNAENFHALNSFFRVHETIASSKEFVRLHRFISNQEGLDYVKEKAALSNAIGSLRGLDSFRNS